MTATLDALLKRATPGPYQVSGVRGKIISGHRTYDYHGIGPDGLEIAAVWFDTRTGAGFMDAKALVAAFNAAPAHLQRIRDLEEGLRPFAEMKVAALHLSPKDEGFVVKTGGRQPRFVDFDRARQPQAMTKDEIAEKVRFAHFGDPCVFCGVGHDDIAPGRCPKNDGKVRVAHYAVLETRWDGVERYRYRTTDGKVHEVHSHVSNHLPYYHFGRSDDLIMPPKYGDGLKTAQVTA